MYKDIRYYRIETLYSKKKVEDTTIEDINKRFHVGDIVYYRMFPPYNCIDFPMPALRGMLTAEVYNWAHEEELQKNPNAPAVGFIPFKEDNPSELNWNHRVRLDDTVVIGATEQECEDLFNARMEEEIQKVTDAYNKKVEHLREQMYPPRDKQE